MTKKIKKLYIFKKIINLNKLEKIYIFYNLFLIIYIFLFPIIYIKNIETGNILKKFFIYNLGIIGLFLILLLIYLVLFNISIRTKKITKKIINIEDNILNILILGIIVINIITLIQITKIFNTYISYSVSLSTFIYIFIVLLIIGIILNILPIKKNKNNIKKFINLNDKPKNQFDNLFITNKNN